MISYLSFKSSTQNAKSGVNTEPALPQQGQNSVTEPNFNGKSDISLPKPLGNDVVELSTDKKEDKKNLTTAQKWGIGIGGAIAGLAALGIAFASHQHGKLSKLYKEKLVLSNLPEKIEFKEAKTVEEAIKFTKEVLGIKNVDKAFEESLDAINVANKGLVDVANANKGKLFLPPGLQFAEMNNNTVAGVVQDVESPLFGHMYINKKFFNEQLLNKELDKRFEIREFAPKAKIEEGVKKAVEQEKKDLKRNELVVLNWDENFRELADKYIDSAENLSMMEKRNLYGIIYNTEDCYANFWDRNPLSSIAKNIKIFTDKGIEVDLDKISKLSIEEQSKELEKLCREYYKKTNTVLRMNPSKYSQEEDIWHEMGHLQDFAKNLKELNLQEFKIGTKDYWKKTWNDIKNHTKTDDRVDVKELENRWATVWKKEYATLLKNNPEKFKKRYPDLYEFVKDPNSQRIAGMFSGYAQSGIGEFIAEVYKEMIRLKQSGKKMSDEVMKLYRKYNGPELPV